MMPTFDCLISVVVLKKDFPIIGFFVIVILVEAGGKKKKRTNNRS